MELIKLNSEYKDKRGVIHNITPDVPVRDILYITGKKGSVRGNHYHKKDRHFCYIVSGSILYQWESKDGSKSGEVLLNPGDIVVNDILEKHRFIFKTAGSFIAMATESRKQSNYEEDTVRESF